VAVHWADRLTLADVDALVHHWAECRDWCRARVAAGELFWQRDVAACEARVQFWGQMREVCRRQEPLSPHVRAFVALGRAPRRYDEDNEP
jgi:hypothetical protein